MNYTCKFTLYSWELPLCYKDNDAFSNLIQVKVLCLLCLCWQLQRWEHRVVRWSECPNAQFSFSLSSHRCVPWSWPTVLVAGSWRLVDRSWPLTSWRLLHLEDRALFCCQVCIRKARIQHQYKFSSVRLVFITTSGFFVIYIYFFFTACVAN